MKKINKIYENYFEIIDSYFGSIKNHLEDGKYSHIDLGMAVADYPMISDLMPDAIDDLGVEIAKFWSENIKSILDSIKKQDSLKCVYSGDITPVVLEDFVKKSLLYIDTVVIPDPILKLTILKKQTTIDKKYYLNMIIRHVFNVWRLKDLILVETEIKPLIILPTNLRIVNEKDRNQLLLNANEKFTNYTNSIFMQKFTNRDDSLIFLKQFKTAPEIFGRIKQFNLLPNTFKKVSTFENFLTDFSNTKKYFHLGDKSIGQDFGEYLLSQFIRVQEHKFFCEKISGEPIYDYDLPYFFFSYEMGGLDMDASITNALQNEKFNWITKVPLPALKVFREENKLEYMRSLLRRGITDLKSKSDRCLLEISKQLESNFIEAFKRQEEERSSLEKEVVDITKKKIPIQVAGSMVGFTPAIGSYISIPFAFRSIKNLLAQRKELKQKIKGEESNFINLLLRSYKEE